MTEPKDRLVWVDIETTGLDPASHYIAEMAMVITDFKFEVLSAVQAIFHINQARLMKSDEFCHKVHWSNGLYDEVVSAGIPEGEEYRQAAQRMLIDEILEAGAFGSPMCGQSVQFDRSFIKEELPDFHDAFSHRNLDVRSVITAAKLANPNFEPPKFESQHRAMPDITNTIETLSFIVRNEFKGAKT